MRGYWERGLPARYVVAVNSFAGKMLALPVRTFTPTISMIQRLDPRLIVMLDPDSIRYRA